MDAAARTLSHVVRPLPPRDRTSWVRSLDARLRSARRFPCALRRRTGGSRRGVASSSRRRSALRLCAARRRRLRLFPSMGGFRGGPGKMRGLASRLQRGSSTQRDRPQAAGSARQTVVGNRPAMTASSPGRAQPGGRQTGSMSRRAKENRGEWPTSLRPSRCETRLRRGPERALPRRRRTRRCSVGRPHAHPVIGEWRAADDTERPTRASTGSLRTSLPHGPERARTGTESGHDGDGPGARSHPPPHRLCRRRRPSRSISRLCHAPIIVRCAPDGAAGCAAVAALRNASGRPRPRTLPCGRPAQPIPCPLSVVGIVLLSGRPGFIDRTPSGDVSVTVDRYIKLLQLSK